MVRLLGLGLMLLVAWVVGLAFPTAPGETGKSAPDASPSGAVSPRGAQEASDSSNLGQLPPEALETLALIKQGGPFPYTKDGTVFQNREGRLPQQARGYYREYTVPTPGARNRGARRIVAGEPGEYYYTHDHYRTFMRIRE